MRLLLLFFVSGLLSCNQRNTKQKELELKEKELEIRERELSQKEKITVSDSNSSKTNQSQADNNLIIGKKLSSNEYGKYHFTIPRAMGRPVNLTINFFHNSNKASYSVVMIFAMDELDESGSTGNFTVDKVNNGFKYVTCKFKDKAIYKLKYSIKNKKWILLDGSDVAPEVESD